MLGAERARDVHASLLTVRPAEERDLDALAEFEVAIARVSFGRDAIDDPRAHRRRLGKAWARDRAGMFVAERSPGGPVVGWLWVSVNTNFATGAAYAQFRSLAVATGAEGCGVAEALFERGLAYVREHGVAEVVGRVHVSNVPMRLVYRAFGFQPQHLTMRLTLE